MSARPLKVLIFLHSFEPGGVESDSLRLGHALEALGTDVAVVMGRATGPLAPRAEGLRLTVLQGPGMPSTAAFETAWMAARLPAVVRRLAPDVVLCTGNTYTIVAAWLRLVLGRRCPPLVLRVSNDLERLDLPAAARWFYHRWLACQRSLFDTVVAMAPPLVAEIERWMRVPHERIRVIPNGSITAATAARLAAARDAAPAGVGRHILGIGRLAPQKNFALLLRAFAAMAGPDDRLTIAGEGPGRTRLAALARRLGIADRLGLPGHVTDLAPLFAAADTFVLSSDYEGLPAVVIEALAAGVRVVATDCCTAMPWLVGGRGRLVPRGDATALATAMAASRGDRPDVAAMRALAAQFTIEAAAPAWRRLLLAVAAQRGAGLRI